MSIFVRKAAPAFHVLIVRPSKYDDEGCVVRYWRGVLPSNTIAVLSALTRQVFDSGRLGPDVRTGIVPLDDTVQAIDVPSLARRYLGQGRRAVVALAGVQSNQFPRAADLAVRFRQAGFEVMIGGFHVSGAIAMAPAMPPEIQAVMDAGVTVVKGEVEEAWGGLLEDAWHARLKPFYDIVEKPDITNAPMPLVDPNYQKRFSYPAMGTIDTGRGCPFSCSFCTIINVQGRAMRCRSAETILQRIEENYRHGGVDFYFFTDDNFARNRNWEAILDGIAALREEKRIPIQFMMQIDTKAWKIPRFIEKAARAGCSQVFLGIESINPQNLAAVDKTQNAVDEMAEMVAAWHHASVVCHAGYIVGFPFDTPQSVARDVETLKAMRFDEASFFMLTPLPGSTDHARMAREGVWMDPDLNRYDSCHETLHLENFAPGEWRRTFDAAWEAFCNFDHAREVLLRSNPRTYWGILKTYMWYRSARLEGAHPMLAGFWRRRPRTDRRPGTPIPGRLQHLVRRVRDGATTLRAWARLASEIQELWLQTRIRPEPSEGRLAVLRRKWGKAATEWLGRAGGDVAEWRDSFGERVADTRRALAAHAEDARRAMGECADDARRAVGEHASNARAWLHESTSGMSARVQGLGETGHLAEMAVRLRAHLPGLSPSDAVALLRSYLPDAPALTELRARAAARLAELGVDDLSTRFRNRLTVWAAAAGKLGGGWLARSVSQALVRWNALGRRRAVTSRAALDQYWGRLALWVHELRFVRLALETPRIGLNLLREARLWATFAVFFIDELSAE